MSFKSLLLRITPRPVKEAGKFIWRMGIFRSLRFDFQYYVLRKTPVLVYQVGKVGSMSVFYSLRARGELAYHTHSLEPGRIHEGMRKMNSPRADVWYKRWLWLYYHVVQPRKRMKVITLVRDPIAQEVSAFFQNLERWTGAAESHQTTPPEELRQLFLSQHVEPTYPLEWFDKELNPVFEMDIYDHPFPQEQGYQIIRRGNFELLVIKLETTDATKERAVTELMGYDDFQLSSTNIGEEKAYAEAYKAFRDGLVIPPHVIEMSCNSRLVRHFYTPEEIDAMRVKWSGKEKAQA